MCWLLQEGLLPIPNALLNDSLLLGGITKATLGSATAAQSLFVHPYVLGGWCGLVATALNCLPVGCLDGGRIMQVRASCVQFRVQMDVLHQFTEGAEWHWCLGSKAQESPAAPLIALCSSACELSAAHLDTPKVHIMCCSLNSLS